MIFTPTTLKDAWLLDLEKRGDSRGFFARTMCTKEFAAHGLVTTFVQQNTSFSADKGTLRGMHFQRGDAAEAKLVRCLRGRIVDIIVDLRGDSPTYMKHEAFELDDQSRRHLYVPPGFAHSFQTLTDDVEVSYLVSSPYTPSAEGGLRYCDPLLGITWPLPVSGISDKDAAWPFLEAGAPPIF
ncbi:dTDP-4-dehydrorhamnose 3,5-epimerase [Sphaerotilus hippei]|uniref:dTDP-4-dehydrorhamnose 3,5-epimerase n=1 Tax=Sphaerotilus hippei TaxID=744406 RepID=A0A318H4S5_9BURK|nr:dTDP-4-dehydrorhamnose 3,5-epimerase [Sphaerotilus hippei]PXW98822.1 dTDP-4-dehydrorhamnose 3,5-epimerase [Sphaerotilus hippei]